MEGIAAIIFDMDGVLLLSSRIHARAFARVYQELGVKGPPYREIAGMRTDEALRYVLARHGTPAGAGQLAALVARKRDLAHALLASEPPLAPDCRAQLARLRGRFRLALASSASERNVALFLAASGAAELFDVVIAGDAVARAKPEPDIYLAALKALGCPPAGALVVEDAVNGVVAARRAGIRVVGISSTHAAEELLAAGAWQVAASLADLVRLVLSHG